MDKKSKLTTEEIKEVLIEYEDTGLFCHSTDEKTESGNLQHTEWIDTFKSSLGLKIIDRMNSEEYMRFKIGELHFIVLNTYLKKRSIENFKIDLDYKIKKGKKINIFSA